MNGNDVALLRKDIQHIAELVGELKEDFKDFREKSADNRERVVKLEVWKQGVSRQLGDLQNNTRDDARKQSIMWGMITAGVISALAKILLGG